jgi:hypothetical protein
MDGAMARKHHKPEEIVTKLRQVEVLSGQGASIAEAAKTIAVTEATSSSVNNPERLGFAGLFGNSEVFDFAGMIGADSDYLAI